MEDSFYNKLSELLPLYEKVKLAILLTENFDEKREMYVAPMNQLRSALDHIFKAVSVEKPENCSYELKEAEEHMTRAGYDALELLAGSSGTSIINKLQPYDTETLTKIYPEYFTRIKPKIIEIQQGIAERRMERKADLDKSFSAYFNEIAELVQISTAVDRIIPSLQEYSDKKAKEKLNKKEEEYKKRRKERLWQYCIGPIIGFVSAAILAVLTWLLTK